MACVIFVFLITPRVVRASWRHAPSRVTFYVRQRTRSVTISLRQCDTFETPALSGRTTGDGVAIRTGGTSPMEIEARLVVNAAGLGAQALARNIEGLPADKVPSLHLAKGNYFSLAGRTPFSRLIYPMPVAGGLGVHLMLDLAGQARFGPDVEWLETIDYFVDPHRAEAFYAAIRTYWPGLPDGALQPGYAGIRPKIARPGVLRPTSSSRPKRIMASAGSSTCSASSRLA